MSGNGHNVDIVLQQLGGDQMQSKRSLGGLLKPSKMPHKWTCRTGKPRLVDRKILLRRGIAVSPVANDAWPRTKSST
jgi:hypothetical protein